ncbi:cyclopropane fatty-acyl-phospholipid synthase-like methyltransferase [Paraburkholderia sp. EB58]|uniref:class I SAM-dependent methyltransferase n=1 Tax=Paraburkholderia sp. EB58 TaxID=3035125 RepID=UPI003D1E8244
MVVNWSVAEIRDPTFRAEFLDIPRVLADWTAEYGGLRNRDILDFGCGEGASSLGIALCHQPRHIVAIDINPKIWNTLPNAKKNIGLDDAPGNLLLKQVDADTPLDDLGMFDVIYSWSVFEHVQHDLIVDCLAKMKRVLRPDGVMFLQTTPLFYSAFGSHFQHWMPDPWSHLSIQHDVFCNEIKKRVGDRSAANDLLCMYENLNRATANQILRAARRVGFDVVKEHRTYDDYPIPDDLREIYSEDVLRTNQLVFIAKHAH